MVLIQMETMAYSILTTYLHKKTSEKSCLECNNSIRAKNFINIEGYKDCSKEDLSTLNVSAHTLHGNSKQNQSQGDQHENKCSRTSLPLGNSAKTTKIKQLDPSVLQTRSLNSKSKIDDGIIKERSCSNRRPVIDLFVKKTDD